MKQKLHVNRWLRTLTGGAALFLFSGLFVPAQATLLLNENFEYNTGDLLGQGGWLRQGTTATSPVQVVDTALTYAGYQDEPAGKAVRIGNSGEDLYKEFTAVTSGTVYLSALVNLNEVQSKTNQGEYFLHFGEGGGSSIFSGRLMAKKSENDKITLGICRSGTSSVTVWDPTEYELNTTLLVVIKYNIVPGEKNDNVDLFVNPVINGTEPEPNITSKTETGVEISRAGSVGIRQGTSTRTALGVIDALRVATTWDELFPGDVPPQPIPVITCSPSPLLFRSVFTGETYTATLNVKATDLQGDISVSLKDGSELSVTETTIEKTVAESENGADLTFTLNPTDPDIYMDEIRLVTPGMDTVKIQAVWSTTAVIPVANIAELRQVDVTNPETAAITYKLTGKCLISHVYKDGNAKYIYIQDHSSAVTVWDAFGNITTEYKTGDELNNLYITLENVFGTLMLLPVIDAGTPLSEDNEIIPQEVTLADLAANPGDYEARLITVKEISFFNRENENEGIFTEGTNNKISQGETEATMRVFKGADFLGSSIPAKANLTGIPTASTGKLIAPRSAADIEEIIDKPAAPKQLDVDFNEGLPEGWEKEAGWEYRSDEGIDGTGCMYIEGPSDYNLTSPTVDLSAGGYKLTYQYKWIPMGDWTEDAIVKVMISNDNGQTFTELGSWKRANSFTEASFDLAAYTSPATKIRFSFIITNLDDWTDGGNGWLDNLKLTSELVSIETQESQNPTITFRNGIIRITAPEAIASVRLINLNGQIIANGRHTDNRTYDMSVENLSSGIYLVEIISGENKTVWKIAIP